MIADYIKDEVMAMKFINPPLVFRMSVTGHRDLGCNQLDAQKLRGKINLVLDVVKSLVATILKSDTAGIYNHSLPPVLRLASGLAAGADQLVADCAVTAGWRLEAVLPFTENEYLKDFDSPESPSQFGAMLGMPWSDDRTAFSALLKKATAEGTCIELCGPTEPPTLRNHSYVAVGKTLVRRSEILLAIWNESKEGGRGGTAEVVEFALRNRLPVIWIASGDCDRRRAEICWLTGVDDFYNALAGGDGVVMFDESKIGNYLHQLLLASCLDSKVADFYDRHVLFKDFRQDMESLLQRESLGGVQMPPYGKFFRWIRDWLYTPDSKYNTDYIWNSKRPYDFEEHFMYVNRIIDWQALTSGEIYRSTYTAIYLLGAMVAVVAMCSTAGFHKMLWIEFPLLIIISLLCLFDVRRNNYKRWIIYRLLAGLLGQSRWLARLGLELRIGRNDLKRDVHKSSGGWVLVYLQSMIRAAPSVCLCIDSASVGLLRAEVCNELLKEGIYYHKINARRSGGIAARLSLASVSLFLLTVAVVYFGCVMSIFSDVPPRISTLLSMLASVLPICSAAIVAFRQSSEFELLEAKSNQMHAALVDAYDRLNKLDCTQPWAAELLGDELVRIADLMTADVADWSLVFKVKAVETA